MTVALRPIPRFLPWLALVGVGIGWGTTGIFSKIIVQAGHHPFGISWTAALLGAVLVAAFLGATGRPLPLARSHLGFYLTAGLFGSALPHVVSFYGYQVLPVGVVAIVLAIVPISTFLAAVAIGLDRPDPRRVLGLALGAGAVALLVLPETSLPAPGQALAVALPVIASLSYSTENILIAKYRPRGPGALQVLAGLLFAALALLTPLVAATGTWMPLGAFDAAEAALLGLTLCHLGAYGGFVWLIGRAGPVFASQVGYVVTLTGVGLGMAIFGETHSGWVWLALVLMLTGLSLVRPRRP